MTRSEALSKPHRPYYLHDKPRPIEPDTIYKFEIEVWATSCCFLKDHRLRIDLACYDSNAFDFGGQRYLRTGEILPSSVLQEFRNFDAILLGAIGHPDITPGLLEKGILLQMRFDLDLYINLRPVKLFPGVDCPLKDKGPEQIDYVVVRENTGDVYTGAGGVMMKGTPHEVAMQTAMYTRYQVDRCLRYAFEFTRRRNRRKTLALVGKTNVLTYMYEMWERAFHEMGDRDYPDIKREY